MSEPGGGERWVIVFRPLASDVPAAIRMRHLLKRALRDWQLRAELVRDPTGDELDQVRAHEPPAETTDHEQDHGQDPS